MKKLFVALLAVAGLTACFNEEVVNVADQRTAIGFEANWVNNATRANEAVDPSTTTESLTGFDVWGFMDEATGVVFEDVDVTGAKGNFSYAETQYWAPGHTYYFAALAPMNSENVKETIASGNAAKLGLGTVAFTNVDGTEDLLYAAEAVEAPALGEAKTVNFTFSHLLSKVKFTFTNGFTNENAYIDVKDVRIVNAPKAGSIDLAVENWWDNDDWKLVEGEEPINLAFGDACDKTAMGDTQETADERLTIPAGADYKYEIQFEVALYMGDVLAYEGTKKSFVEGVALEMGKAYNFKATLNASNFTEEGVELMPIVFDVVEVKDWVEAGEQTTVLPGDISNLTLVADAVAKSTLNLEGSFDGAGHKLTAETVGVKSGAARLIDAQADSRISNLEIDGNNFVAEGNYGIRALFFNGAGEFVVENVNIYNVTYTMNDDSAAKTLKVANSTLAGWTSYNPATTARFENVAFVSGGTYNTVRPHGTTTFKNCSFDNTTIDLSKLQGTVNFEGCTYNGRALTSADLISAPEGAVSIKLVVTEAPANNGLVQNVTEVKDMTIDGGNYKTTDGKGLRGIYITKGGEYNVENVVVRNVTYAINVNTTAAVTLNVKNSTLEGWTSYGTSTTASFDTVAFECGEYANFKPYSSTVLKNCSFEAGFMIDFTSLSGVITFENCTYNDVVLTAENFAATANFDGDYTGKIAF